MHQYHSNFKKLFHHTLPDIRWTPVKGSSWNREVEKIQELETKVSILDMETLSGPLTSIVQPWTTFPSNCQGLQKTGYNEKSRGSQVIVLDIQYSEHWRKKKLRSRVGFQLVATPFKEMHSMRKQEAVKRNLIGIKFRKEQ